MIEYASIKKKDILFGLLALIPIIICVIVFTISDNNNPKNDGNKYDIQEQNNLED